MKNQKPSIWTLNSNSKKNSSAKIHLRSMRQVCTNKSGFDAALLQLGLSIAAHEHEEQLAKTC